MREVFFLIGDEGEILWSDASDSPTLLPDSRARWEAIWSRREANLEIAHSHPVGPLAFSRTDETTMSALRSGLGRDYVFTVVAPNGVIRTLGGVTEIVYGPEPEWVGHLRRASRMHTISRAAGDCARVSDGPPQEPRKRREAPESSRALVGVGVSGAKPRR